jgi:hypothetical protein
MMPMTFHDDDYRAAAGVSGSVLPANLLQPPLQALPVDTTPGDWVPVTDTDAAERQAGYDDSTPFTVDAVPLIGAVTLGGDIVLAATVSVPANGWVDVGELGASRPSALELWIIAGAAGLEIQGIGTGTSAAAGFPIPSTRELVIHARAAHVHNTTGAAVTVSFMLVSLGTQ